MDGCREGSVGRLCYDGFSKKFLIRSGGCAHRRKVRME